jgi:hypothetical protein
MIALLGLFTVFVSVLIGRGILHAARADHLLAFYWGEGEIFLFVRRPDGRYDRIRPWMLPLTALKYESAWLQWKLRRPKPAPALAAPGRPVHRFARLA